MALRVLHLLSTFENIASGIEDCNGMEKLMLCLRSRNTINEIPRLTAKVLFNYYTSSVLLL